ncbi:ISSod12, transposase [Vibrio splendidus 12B01]|nr:ISSod12, transposase [Vibrio splendidus 12B01]
MPQPRYKTTNWKQYNQSLINRGSLTFWIERSNKRVGAKQTE